MKIMNIALSALALTMPGSLLAHGFELGSLTVGHPMVFETAPTSMAAGGYLTITNSGNAPDRLIGVRADFPRSEIHVTEEKDGVARMLPIEAVDLPPGETVAFEPGGMHVMFIGLGGDALEEGEEFPATLVFETAGELEVNFVVEKRSNSSVAGDHSHHNH